MKSIKVKKILLAAAVAASFVATSVGQYPD